MKQQDKIFMVVGSTVVAVAAGVTGVYLFAKTDSSALPSQSTTSAVAPPVTAAASPSVTTTADAQSASTTAYKDGTYNATVSYSVPHGYTNQLAAKVTLSNGTITDVNVQDTSSDHESAMYIDNFESALKNAVVGKTIDGLSPGRIGGATLTTEAFDNALAQIQTNAKA